MEGNNVQLLAIESDFGPSCPMGYNAVLSVAGDPFHILYRESGSYHLRIIIPVPAHINILVAIAGCQFLPIIGKITLLLRQALRRIGIIQRNRLRPHAHIRILLPHPIRKPLVIVCLPVPHPIQNVPIKHPQGLGGCAGGEGGECYEGCYGCYGFCFCHYRNEFGDAFHGQGLMVG